MASEEVRPPWWRIALGAWVGVNGGGFLLLAIEGSLFYLVQAALGRAEVSAALSSLGWVGVGLNYLRWAAYLAVMQLISVAVAGWTKVLWATAALQTVTAILILNHLVYFPVWIMPPVMALCFLKTSWPDAIVARARRAELKRQPTQAG